MSDPRDLTSVLSAAEAAAESGDFPAAERHLREAATLQEARLGSLHPDLANTLNNLAIVCEKVDKADEAERHYRRAFSIATAVLPPEHPFVATSRTNLKEFCDAKGRPFELPPPTPPARPTAASKPASAAAPPPAPKVEAATPAPPPSAPKPKPTPAPPPVKAKGAQAARAKAAAAAAAAAPAAANGEAKGGRRSGPPTAQAEALRAEAPRTRSLGPVAIGLALVGVIVLVTIVASRPETPSAGPVVKPAPATIANSAPPPPPPPIPAKGSGPASSDRAAAPKPQPVAPAGTSAAFIVNAGLCKRIETGVDWECDKVSSPVDAGTLLFYTRVRSPRDTTVQHRWYRGTDLMRSVDLRIKANLGSGYRTYSRYGVERGPGEWRIEVRAADGSVLREERFTVR